MSEQCTDQKLRFQFLKAILENLTISIWNSNLNFCFSGDGGFIFSDEEEEMNELKNIRRE